LKIFRTLPRNGAFRTRIFPLIISLTLLFSVLIIALTPPLTGYELSIYDAYPPILWVLISINIFFSIYTIIQSCDNQLKNSYYGYFSILLIETIIIILPIIRGYYSMSSTSGDIYYHMLSSNQILNSGHLPIMDDYPIMHIWLSILHNFFPDFIILTLLLSIVFFILYILSLYIFGKTVLGTKNGGIFVSIFGIPLIFSYGHYAFYPFLFALFIIPLILFAYQKIIQYPVQKNSFYICVIFLSFFIVFCHPMISVFLIIIFSIFTFYELFKRRESLSGLLNIEATTLVFIISLTLILWWLQFRSILFTLQTMVSALLGQEEHATIISYQLNQVTTSNASIWIIIDRFIKIYGPISIYFSISMVFLLYIIYKYVKNVDRDENVLIYSLQFFVAICIGIALATGYFVIFEPIRAAMYGLILATILCGMFFYRIWFSDISEKRRLGLIASMTVIITIVCMLTILSLYSSPWVGKENSGLTYEDKNRIDWFLEYRNTDIRIVNSDVSYPRYSEYYFEITNANRSQKLNEYTLSIPTHFGYDTISTIGNLFTFLPDNEVYMITSETMNLMPYVFPPERRHLVSEWNERDYLRLMNDPSVKLVYSSKESEVWGLKINHTDLSL
jgi:hypothetical protein